MDRNQRSFFIAFTVLLLFIAVKLVSLEKNIDLVSGDIMRIENQQQQLSQSISQTISQSLEEGNCKILNYNWQMQEGDIPSLQGTVKFSVVLKEKAKEEQIYLLAADKEKQQKILLHQETGLTFVGELQIDLTKDYDISIFSEGAVSWQQPVETINFGSSLTGRFYPLNSFGLQAREFDRKKQMVVYQDMFGIRNDYTEPSCHIVSGNIAVLNGEKEIYHSDDIWVVPAEIGEIILLNIGDKAALESYLEKQEGLDKGDLLETLFPFDVEQYGKEITVMNPTQIKIKITLQDQAGFIYRMVLEDRINFATVEDGPVPEPSMGIGDFVLLPPTPSQENELVKYE